MLAKQKATEYELLVSDLDVCVLGTHFDFLITLVVVFYVRIDPAVFYRDRDPGFAGFG